MHARKRRTRIQPLTNSDYKFNLFQFSMEKKLRNADKKRGIKAKYDIKYYILKGRYIGETDDGFFWQTREGKGIYYYESGARYEGDWKNGNKEGKGIYYYESGARYEGDWKNGNKEGKGIYYYNDGARYEGDWKNDNKEGKGIYYYNDGDRYEGDWKKDILMNGKAYYKSTPKNRKDVFLQINENDSKEDFLSKHEDGDFIYTDDERKKYNNIKPNTNYDHLKIMYKDHGGEKRDLTENIDPDFFTEYQKNNLKSVYISSSACYGGFYDSNGNNLFNIVKEMIENAAYNCVGFVSLMKAKNSTVYEQTTNEKGKKGAKRVPTRKENIENISDKNYDKNNDFEYYCIIQEDGEQKIYQIPSQLCYWREYLIDNGKFQEALDALKNNQDYTFDANVILNDRKSTKTKMEITIPHEFGKDKDKIEEVKIMKETYYSENFEIRKVRNSNAKYNQNAITINQIY